MNFTINVTGIARDGLAERIAALRQRVAASVAARLADAANSNAQNQGSGR